MKKRFLPALLALWMALSLLPVQALAAGGAASFEKVNTYEEGQFTDVSPDAWYAGSVRSAYELGLMTGTGEDRFSPDGAVTLAQAVTMAARLHCIFYTGTESFRQGGSPWYAVYVDYAREAGILTEDYPDYGAQATRGQFARLFARALPAAALEEINPVADGAIRDVGADHGNAPEIYLLYRAGVLTGSDGAFRPSDSIQRAEAAAIVTRMAVPDQRVKLPGGDDGGAPAWEGDPALDFTLELLDGSSFTLSEQAGKAVLVNFWATWCGPCRMANKTMAPMKEELKDKDILYLYITGETSPLKTWENMIPDIHGEHFRLTDAQWKYLSDAFKIEGVPTYLIVDREGNTTFRQTGFPGVEKMKEELLKVTK